jgi:hypothetical protein
MTRSMRPPPDSLATATSLVVRTTSEALNSHSPSRPIAPCPFRQPCIGARLTECRHSLGQGRQVRQDLLVSLIALKTHLVLYALYDYHQSCVHIALPTQRGRFAEQFDPDCQSCPIILLTALKRSVRGMAQSS